MKIGIKLKEARLQAGLTQENVAEKIQVTRQTISNWETEKSFQIGRASCRERV